MREPVRFKGQMKRVTISRTADRWYAAILIDTEILPHERNNHGSVGVDLGVKALAVLSDGMRIAGPKAHIIGIENLHVSGMVNNRRLARSIMDQSFWEFRRQLHYKADMYGAQVFVADRWFPSSKMCSRCREIKETLTLEQRVFECECGNKMDRDLNAAINLRTFAASSAEKQNACGDNSSGAAPAA